MTEVRWQLVESPKVMVREVLALEAPDIPGALIDAYEWEQTDLELAVLWPDSEMLLSHDRDEVHVRRRDGFVEVIRAGQALPPLIALGPRLRLVDGYARFRALRWLGVERASVLRQRTDG